MQNQATLLADHSPFYSATAELAGVITSVAHAATTYSNCRDRRFHSVRRTLSFGTTATGTYMASDRPAGDWTVTPFLDGPCCQQEARVHRRIPADGNSPVADLGAGWLAGAVAVDRQVRRDCATARNGKPSPHQQLQVSGGFSDREDAHPAVILIPGPGPGQASGQLPWC
jgi:hypothetical protein